jgi:hypothetical protein
MRKPYIKVLEKENTKSTASNIADMRARFKLQFSGMPPKSPIGRTAEIQLPKSYGNPNKSGSYADGSQSQRTQPTAKNHSMVLLGSNMKRKMSFAHNAISHEHSNSSQVAMKNAHRMQNDSGKHVPTERVSRLRVNSDDKISKENLLELKNTLLNKVIANQALDPVHQKTETRHHSHAAHPEQERRSHPQNSFGGKSEKNEEIKLENELYFKTAEFALNEQSPKIDDNNFFNDNGNDTPSKRPKLNSPFCATPDFPLRHASMMEDYSKYVDSIYEKVKLLLGADKQSFNKEQLAFFLNQLGLVGSLHENWRCKTVEDDSLVNILLAGFQPFGEGEIDYLSLRSFLTTAYALQQHKIWPTLNMDKETRYYWSPKQKRLLQSQQASNRFQSFSKNQLNISDSVRMSRKVTSSNSYDNSTSNKVRSKYETDSKSTLLNTQKTPTYNKAEVQNFLCSLQKLPISADTKTPSSLHDFPSLRVYSDSIEEVTPSIFSKRDRLTSINEDALEDSQIEDKPIVTEAKGRYNILMGESNSQHNAIFSDLRSICDDSPLVYSLKLNDPSQHEHAKMEARDALAKGIGPYYKSCTLHNSAVNEKHRNRGEFLYCLIVELPTGPKHLPIFSLDNPQSLISDFALKYELDNNSRARVAEFLIMPKPQN